MMKRIFKITLILSFFSTPAFAAGGGGDVASEFWNNYIFSMINFAVFVAVLWKYVWPRIQEFFGDRRATIMADLDEARRLREEAQQKLDEYSSRLDNLEAERQEIMDDYHAQGRREKDRLIADASRQVEKMRKDAEVLIASETRRAVASIEQKAVTLAVNLATDTVKTQMDDGTQNTLVANYVGELKEMTQ